MLFNHINNKIITNYPKELGYRMGNNQINIICLIADSAENLQTLLLKFDQVAASLNTEISLSKTKSLVISRNNIKCEVKLRDTVIEQVPKFNYLLVNEILSRRRGRRRREQLVYPAVSITLYGLTNIYQQKVRYAFIKLTCALC
jgi:hypothetical protein